MRPDDRKAMAITLLATAVIVLSILGFWAIYHFIPSTIHPSVRG